MNKTIEKTDVSVYAIYIRVSTDKQADFGDSIEMQEELGTKIINENRGILYRVYVEPAVSASKTKLKDRAVLMECLSDAKTGLFSKLIVYRRDRLSRKAEDSLAIRSMLEAAKCEIIFSASGEMQMMLNDPYGKLMENIRASLDEIESATISVRVSDTLNSKAEKGEHTGGNLVYGYQNIEGRITIVDEEKSIIREIEDLYLKGFGVYSIVKWLNGGEIRDLGKRKLGKAKRIKQHKRCSENWTRDVVETILFSKFYCGFIERSKSGQRKFQKDNNNIILAKGNHDPIRTIERQNAIESMKEKRVVNIAPPRMYQTSFLLTGLLYCGECGEKFISRNSTRKNKSSYLYYLCSSKYHREVIRGCENHSYKKEVLEEYTVQQIKKYMMSLDLENIAKKVEQKMSQVKSNNSSELAEIHNRINRLEKSKNAIKRLLFELDENDENYELLRDEYQADQTNLIKELNEAKKIKVNIENSIDNEKNTKISSEEFLRNTCSFIENFDKLPPINQKVLLDSIIDKIEIYKNGDVKCSVTIDTGHYEVEEPVLDFMSFGGVGDTIPPKNIKFAIDITPSISGNIDSWCSELYLNIRARFSDWIKYMDETSNPYRLHKRTGLSYFVCRMYFKGKMFPTYENVSRVAECYNKTINDFLNYVGYEGTIDMLYDVVKHYEVSKVAR